MTRHRVLLIAELVAWWLACSAMAVLAMAVTP